MLHFAPIQCRCGDVSWVYHHTSLISRRIFPHKLSPCGFLQVWPWPSLGSSDLGPWIWLINYMFTVYTEPSPAPRVRSGGEIISENFQQHLVSHKLEQNSICPRIWSVKCSVLKGINSDQTHHWLKVCCSIYYLFLTTSWAQVVKI